MTDEKFIEAVERGARIQVSLAGVSSPCINSESGRQVIIRSLMDKQMPIPTTLVYEDENKYDSNAIRVDLAEDGVDIGYIPKSGIASLYIKGFSRPKKIYRDAVNALIREVSGELTGNIIGITGGYNRRVNAGVVLELKISGI